LNLHCSSSKQRTATFKEMNDSFLEDLELAPVERKVGNPLPHIERNITRRRSQPSPVPACSDQDELNLLIAKQHSKQNPKQKITDVPLKTKTSRRRSDESKESPRLVGKDAKVPEVLKSRMPERRSKPMENKLKLVEKTTNIEIPGAKYELNDRHRRSGGSNKEVSRCSDGSSKENSRPSDSSRESISQPEPIRERIRSSGDGISLRKDSTEQFEVAMLNSVKEIVSTYTKNESIKILRAMQELYINSQANLIKLVLQQTDEIVNEVGSSKNSPRMRSLIEENARLRENIAILEARNEEFKKSLEESEQIRQENQQLKQHCKELLKSVNSKESCSDGKASEEKRRPSSSSREKSSQSSARRFLEIYRTSK